MAKDLVVNFAGSGHRMGMVRNFDGYKIVQQTLKRCPSLLDITSGACANQAGLPAKSADTMEATSVVDLVGDSGTITPHTPKLQRSWKLPK